MKKQLTFLFLFIFPIVLAAQEVTEKADTLRKDALRVYMSASDYIKREIPFINYVRDLNEAQVYIISTSQRTGSGGREYTYFIEGQKEFAGMRDTVVAICSFDDTQEQIRQKQVSVLKMGLMRYVLKTPLAKHIEIKFNKPLKEEVSTDKWDNWVFRTGINAYLNGQNLTKYSDTYGSFSASRVTQAWKYVFDLDYSRGKDTYKIDYPEGSDLEDTEIISENKSKSFNALIVKSISDHWSVGGTYAMGSSTYSNYRFRTSLSPGIEFNIFPYSESTRRQFSFLYSAGYRYNNYNDTTVYNKTLEHLWMQSLRGTYSIIQKWGSISLSSYWSNYFHDWALNYLSFYAGINFRITKGLSFNVSGNTSLIHNQISLSKGGATQEEILTRQKELETNYSYYVSFGLSYTFGSIFNNVVNPRFDN